MRVIWVGDGLRQDACELIIRMTHVMECLHLLDISISESYEQVLKSVCRHGLKLYLLLESVALLFSKVP